VSCRHPAAPITRVRVDRGSERGIEQLSPSGAVQLRVTKGHAGRARHRMMLLIRAASASPGTVQLVLP
jgi:hypothetical protein